MSSGLTEPALRRLYEDLRKTDLEIAEFFGIDRTSVVHLRKKYGVNSRKTIGEIGEEMVEKELRSRGFLVENMNKVDKLHPFDLLMDKDIRIEVKSSKLYDDDYFVFGLTEKPGNNNVESEHRIKFGSGRTKKVFSKTCDLMIFVGIESNGDCHFFILKPTELNEKLHAVKVSLNPFSSSKYNKYREDWNLLEDIKKARLLAQSDHEQNLVTDSIPRSEINMPKEVKDFG